MGIFDRKSDPLEERALNLLPVAEMVALQSIELKARLKAFRDADEIWWRFFVTVAVVFVASTRLRNLELGREREERLMEIVAKDLQRWHPRAYDAFEDCKAFFERTYSAFETTMNEGEERFISSDAVGGWIAWNILDHLPETDAERRLVRSIGVVVTVPAYRAWSDPKGR